MDRAGGRAPPLGEWVAFPHLPPPLLPSQNVQEIQNGSSLGESHPGDPHFSNSDGCCALTVFPFACSYHRPCPMLSLQSVPLFFPSPTWFRGGERAGDFKAEGQPRPPGCDWVIEIKDASGSGRTSRGLGSEVLKMPGLKNSRAQDAPIDCDAVRAAVHQVAAGVLARGGVQHGPHPSTATPSPLPGAAAPPRGPFLSFSPSRPPLKELSRSTGVGPKGRGPMSPCVWDHGKSNKPHV